VPEPLAHRPRGKRGELAQRADAEPFEHVRERLQLWSGAEERHGQWGEEIPDRLVDDDA
jgi:hypothetical protein